MTGSALTIPHLNLVFAWVWILGGFVSGALMGMRFQDANWLGGYASFKRRLYRLGHISFFGLAMVNFLFYLTSRSLGVEAPVAGWGFIAGGLTMPVCCLISAHFPKARAWLLFAAPVSSLLVGGLLTLNLLLKS